MKKSESDGDGKKRCKKGNEQKSGGDGMSDGNKNNTDREIKEEDKSTEDVKKSESDGDGKKCRKKGSEQKSDGEVRVMEIKRTQTRRENSQIQVQMM